MNWKILLSSIVILMTLTACSSSIREIMTVKTEVKKPSLNLPNPDPLVMKEVKWVVITRDNAEQIFAELESKGEPIAMFGMTTVGYENLTLNMQDIKAYLLEQKQILLQYREYYEGEDKDDAKE